MKGFQVRSQQKPSKNNNSNAKSKAKSGRFQRHHDPNKSLVVVDDEARHSIEKCLTSEKGRRSREAPFACLVKELRSKIVSIEEGKEDIGDSGELYDGYLCARVELLRAEAMRQTHNEIVACLASHFPTADAATATVGLLPSFVFECLSVGGRPIVDDDDACLSSSSVEENRDIGDAAASLKEELWHGNVPDVKRRNELVRGILRSLSRCEVALPNSTSSSGETNSERTLFADHLLPCGRFLNPPQFGSFSVFKRCSVLVHDHWQQKNQKQHQNKKRRTGQGVDDERRNSTETTDNDDDKDEKQKEAERNEGAWKIAREITQIAEAQRMKFLTGAAEFILLQAGRCKDDEEEVEKVLVCGIANTNNEDEQETEEEEQHVTVRFRDVQHTILQSQYKKLHRLFQLTQDQRDASDDIFFFRLFCLLHRYFALTGCTDTPEKESGWHGAVPPQCMQSMHSGMGVSCEAFASPFNTCTSVFCSAFYDVDRYFGSLGSFFDLALGSASSLPAASGLSFEVNPPFDHAVAIRTAQHMLELCCAANKEEEGKTSPKKSETEEERRSNNTIPVSFVLILPYSDKGKVLPSIQTVASILRGSDFLTHEESIAWDAAPYVDGNQLCVKDSYFTARVDTRVFVVQNDAGKRKWPPQAAVAELIRVWTGRLSSDACAIENDEQQVLDRKRERQGEGKGKDL